jgi:hypothetical protein
MVSMRLPRTRGWGNPQVPCETSSAYLQRIECTSPVFPRLVQQAVPDTAMFLGRPRLLTRM